MSLTASPVNSNPEYSRMPARIEVPNDDARKRLQILRLVVDVLGSQAELANVLGVARSTVSQWLSAERQVEEWHVVLAACARAIRHHPEHKSRIVEIFAADILDTHGRWVPEDPEQVGDYAEEAEDVTIAAARLHVARRDGDPVAIRVAGEDLVREAHEASVAARRGAA